MSKKGKRNRVHPIRGRDPKDPNASGPNPGGMLKGLHPRVRPGAMLSRQYFVCEDHVELIKEVERLSPELAPVFDWDEIPPGSESIETLSHSLYRRMQKSLDHRLFMLFAKLNGERLTDYMDCRLKQTCYPLDRGELISEVFARLFRGGFARQNGRPATSTTTWREPQGTWTVFHMLAEALDSVMEEMVEELLSSAMPIPGVPIPSVASPQVVVEDAQEFLQGLNCQITEDHLQHWIAHAFLRLPLEERKVVYLRHHLDLPLEEVSRSLNCTPLEATRRLREAMLHLHQQLESVWMYFQGDGASKQSTGRTEDASAGTQIKHSPKPRVNPGGSSEEDPESDE